MDDILRVLAELHTFTSDDVAEALEMTRSGANFHLDDLLSGKWVERVKSGHNYVYGLSDKALRRIAKLPPVDLEERCLMLWVCSHSETIVKSWIGSSDIVQTQHICQECGEIVKWTSRQNWYRGWKGATMDETDHLKK